MRRRLNGDSSVKRGSNCMDYVLHVYDCHCLNDFSDFWGISWIFHILKGFLRLTHHSKAIKLCTTGHL